MKGKQVSNLLKRHRKPKNYINETPQFKNIFAKIVAQEDKLIFFDTECFTIQNFLYKVCIARIPEQIIRFNLEPCPIIKDKTRISVFFGNGPLLKYFLQITLY